ncbi:MAG: hypothetical protein ACP5XB_28500 [Isosphaeraceae bacterium]
MPNLPRQRNDRLPVLALVWIGASIFESAFPACAKAQGAPLSVKQLLRLSGPELDALYQQGTAVGIPPGRVRGTAILAPGTRRNQALALGTRLVWQGKIINPAGTGAVNRFFGLPIVRARVYQDRSWLDGAPSLVLDYSQTSRIYARDRDEIRQIAPGLFLGIMYSRTEPRPTLLMYFVLEVQS